VTRQWDGRLGFDSWQGQGIFLFATASRLALGPTNPPTQWISRALSPGVKRPGREADHSPPSTAPLHLHGVVLSWSQGQLHLYYRCIIRQWSDYVIRILSQLLRNNELFAKFLWGDFLLVTSVWLSITTFTYRLNTAAILLNVRM